MANPPPFPVTQSKLGLQVLTSPLAEICDWAKNERALTFWGEHERGNTRIIAKPMLMIFRKTRTDITEDHLRVIHPYAGSIRGDISNADSNRIGCLYLIQNGKLNDNPNSSHFQNVLYRLRELARGRAINWTYLVPWGFGLSDKRGKTREARQQLRIWEEQTKTLVSSTSHNNLYFYASPNMIH